MVKKKSPINDAVEVYAWTRLAEIFLDGVLTDRYPNIEAIKKYAETVKQELDGGIKKKAQGLIKWVKEQQ